MNTSHLPSSHTPQHSQRRCGHQRYNNSTTTLTAVMWHNFTLWQLLLHLSFVPQAWLSFTRHVPLKYISTATVHAFAKLYHFYTPLHKIQDTKLHQPDPYSLHILMFTYPTGHELTLYTKARLRFEQTLKLSTWLCIMQSRSRLGVWGKTATHSEYQYYSR